MIECSLMLLKAALLLASAALYAQDVTVDSGLADYQVLQRDNQGRASARIAGAAAGASSVAIRVTNQAGLVLETSAAVTAGKFTANVAGIPTGGPYTVEVKAGARSAKIREVLVGDLWLLAGQSNMEGVGDLVDVEQPNMLVHSFDQADNWGIATEPLHNLPGAADRVHWRQNANKELERLTGDALQKFIANRKKGAGLGLPFAVQMVRRTGIPVGLLPCAHGGTSMDQWSPDLRDKGGDSLYGATLRRFKLAGGRVTGILWYQGESDASPKASVVFAEKFEKLIAAFRADFGQPDLPFYYVQIGRHVANTNQAEWNKVQDEQRKAELKIARVGMVTAIDSILDDGIHVNTQDQKRIGRRMADLAVHDVFPNLTQFAGVKRGPRPENVALQGSVIRIRFSGVNGRLRAPGRIAGFSIHNAAGEAVPLIFKTLVDPENGSGVLLYIGGKLPEGATLRYGAGRDPYCNLTDEADMGVPVFGPLPIQ